jgi:hypothetical protein
VGPLWCSQPQNHMAFVSAHLRQTGSTKSNMACAEYRQTNECYAVSNENTSSILQSGPTWGWR